ncbi:type II secretion system protein N [Aquincola sp. MAHUQ-54]|uniref:Type II secretion system protein N n=1 Tax=Aquincola agrisoli TaxID=3119538 RepID=A0AAW9QN31_9BURK
MTRWTALRPRRRGPHGAQALPDGTAPAPRRTRRWGFAGAAAGLLLAFIAFAPATWLARGVASATGEHLLLAQTRGTVWSGSALPVLTAGPESRTALALPGRLEWSVRWRGWSVDLLLRQPCCLAGEVVLRLQPGFGRLLVAVQPSQAGGLIGQWPAGWLAGLGTPWNALQLSGTVQLQSQGLAIEQVAGRTRFTGEATLELANAATPLAPLDSLGSYRMTLRGDAASGEASTITLTTLEGALQASGQGQWGEGRLRFRGELRAADGQEGALSNLLNIVGRRQGALSVISIG